MKKNKYNPRFFILTLSFITLLGFIFFKDQVKVTIVNSFSEAYADSNNYFVLNSTQEEIKSLEELSADNKKTFIFITSNWCSLCDAITVKIKENINENPEYLVYEADIDEHRSLLDQYKVTKSPSLILVNSSGYKLINDLRFDNLEQILSTEL